MSDTEQNNERPKDVRDSQKKKENRRIREYKFKHGRFHQTRHNFRTHFTWICVKLKF